MMKVNTGWVARDEDGGLKLHWEKPRRFERYEGTYAYWFSCDWVSIPKHMYQGLNWEDEPFKVKVDLLPD